MKGSIHALSQRSLIKLIKKLVNMSKVEFKHKFAQKDQERKTRKELKIALIFLPENQVILILSFSAGCHCSVHLLSRAEKGKTSPGGGGDTRYIPGWGGAARPLIP